MVEVSNFERDFFLGLQGSNSVQLRLQRLQACSFDATFVHARGPIVSNLLLYRPTLRIVGTRGFQGLAQQILVPQLQAAPRSPEHLVGRDRIRRPPFATCVLVAVLAW